MLKKIIVMLLMCMVSNLAVFALASKKQDDTEKMRAEVAKLGTGKDARVTVKLKDGKKIKGYISEVSSDSFIVTDNKTGATTEIQYSDVRQAKGKSPSLGAAIAIGVGASIGLALLLAAISKRD